MHHVINNSKEPTVSCSWVNNPEGENQEGEDYETPEPILFDQHKKDNYKIICIHERNKGEVQFLSSSQLVWDDAQLQEKRKK